MLGFWATKWAQDCLTEKWSYYRIYGAKDGPTYKNDPLFPNSIPRYHAQKEDVDLTVKNFVGHARVLYVNTPTVLVEMDAKISGPEIDVKLAYYVYQKLIHAKIIQHVGKFRAHLINIFGKLVKVRFFNVV